MVRTKSKTTITPAGVTAASADLEAAQMRLAELRPAYAEKRREIKQAVIAASAVPGPSATPWAGDAPAPGEPSPVDLQPVDLNVLQAEGDELKERIDHQVERCVTFGREEAREVAGASRAEWLKGLQKFADALIVAGQAADAVFDYRVGLLDHCGEREVANSVLATALPLPAVMDFRLSADNNRLIGWIARLELLGVDVSAGRKSNKGAGV